MSKNKKDNDYMKDFNENDKNISREPTLSEVDNKKKPSLGMEIKSFTKDIIITVAIVFFIISFIVQPTTVDGHSMNPTLHDKDQLIIEKISHRFINYSRYDIVVFPYLKEDNKYFIKRIIGLPGETINIINGEIYINELVLDEPFGFELIEDYGSNILPLTIPDEYYFVVGDNRNHSKDSRYMDVGFVKGSDILGKGYIRLFPFDGFGFIN